MAVHRATLKRKQKQFKSAHRSKGEIKAANKGRIEKGGSGSKIKTLSKNDRKNAALQARMNKKVQLLADTKIFDGNSGCPRNITVIALSPDVDNSAFVQSYASEAELVADPNVPLTFRVPKFKQGLRFYTPSYDNLYEILDAARSADFCVFLLSLNEEAGDYGEQIVRCISAQGATSFMGVVCDNLGENANRSKSDIKALHVKQEALNSWFSHFYSEHDKLFLSSSSSDMLAFTRSLCQKRPRGVRWREDRSYLVSEAFQYSPESSELSIQGIVRSKGLSPDQSVHITGVGDLNILSITEVLNHAQDGSVAPRTWISSGMPEPKLEAEGVDMRDEILPDFSSTGVRIDGHSYVDGSVEDAVDEMKTIDKVPAGMSKYQASWLLEGEDYGLDEEDNEEENFMTDEEGDLVLESEMNDDDDDSQSSDGDDMLTEEDNVRPVRADKLVRDDLEYPDEIELRPSESAKERLSRYRGVRNIRAVDWDARERDQRTPNVWPFLTRATDTTIVKNRGMKQLAENPDAMAGPGTRVLIKLQVDEDQAKKLQSVFSKAVQLPNSSLYVSVARPLSIYALLPSEVKLSSMNFSLITDSEFQTPIKSKSPIVIQYGPRRMLIEPIFSQPGAQRSNNVYKFFRYLHPGQTATVSAVLPMLTGDAPTVYLTTDPNPQLIGTGTCIDADADRVIVKSCILTGAPLKIHKKLVTIRYMFFNSDDVHWFKEVPLFTKSGRSGYIKESLGTHGLFKATFNGKLTAQDVISMALYKRIWPRKAEVLSE